MEKYKNKKNQHCCELMKKFIKDPRVGINYDCKFREYDIDLLGRYAFQKIFHCPFCGIKLPKSLKNKYLEILEKEYKIDDPWDEKQEKLIPEEFKTDEWWKTRNIKPKEEILNLDQLKVEKDIHCCKLMNFLIEEKKVAIFYNPIFREFSIGLGLYPGHKQAIYACPWCGFEFPKSLIDKYFEILQKEYNICHIYRLNKYVDCSKDEEYGEEKVVALPEEFKSDEWWKKRSL